MRSNLFFCLWVGAMAWGMGTGWMHGQVLEKFYGWPPGPDWPQANGEGYWDWRPAGPENTPGTSALDLRGLNEAQAGEHGWVVRKGDKLYLGDGRPVRFWAVNTTAEAPREQMEWLARELARRGVNMMRIHGGASKSLLDFKQDDIMAVNAAVIDQMHRAVTAAKREGIYVFVSNTLFIIQFQVKASYQIEGYTQDWLDAHADWKVPFGLVFFDERLREAFRHWLATMATAPNPYEPDRRPLARDPAVAVFEIQNEDNLFFHTLRPERWPEEQQAKVGRQFFRWVAVRERRFGESDAETVGRMLASWKQPMKGDDVAAGVLRVSGAGEMAVKAGAGNRWEAQMAFMGEVQREFQEEMTSLLREAGYEGLVSPSNWKTADERRLLDLEHYTYAAGDIIDRHYYFSPVVAKEKVKHRIGPGDAYLGISALADPARSPGNVRQLEGYPSALSEFQWVQYNPAIVEGPLTAAAYFALTDFDVPVWFALPNVLWNPTLAKWGCGRPSVLGQFPGAALLFRRGDVAEGPVVVREGRSLGEIFRGEPAALMPGSGFDSTRDEGQAAGVAAGAVDPLAMLVGKVEFAFDTDRDRVWPELGKYIDRGAGQVRSATGEILTDWKRGICLVDTPRAQGMTGFLRAQGAVGQSDVTWQSQNAFGALLAISLDGKPLRESGRILLQAGAVDRLTGARTTPVEMRWGEKSYAGHQVAAEGKLPWQVERVAASVVLRGAGARLIRATVLDANLAERGAAEVETVGADLRVTLPEDALTTVVELR